MSRRRSTTAVAAHAAIAVAIFGPECVSQGANASYGWLFPDDKAAPAAVASEPGKADDGVAGTTE